MLKTVEGIYRDGKVELLEAEVAEEGARVLVTILPRQGAIDLREAGVSQEEAAELRWRFGAIAEDWDRPEMEVYDEAG